MTNTILNWDNSGLAECAAFLFEHDHNGLSSAQAMADWFKGLVQSAFANNPRPTYISTAGFVATVYWNDFRDAYCVHMSVMTYTAQKACDALKAKGC